MSHWLSPDHKPTPACNRGRVPRGRAWPKKAPRTHVTSEEGRQVPQSVFPAREKFPSNIVLSGRREVSPKRGVGRCLQTKPMNVSCVLHSAPTTGPLHLSSSLPWTFCPWFCTCLVPFLPSGLRSHISFSERPFLPTHSQVFPIRSS